MMQILGLVFSGLFLSNVLIMNLVGLPIMEEKQVSLKPALKIGLLTTVLAVVSMAIVYPINNFLLVDAEMTYLLPILAILVIALVSMLINFISKKLNIDLKAHKIFLPMISFNVVVFFIALQGVGYGKIVQSLVYALGAGLGYTLLLLMMTAIHPRLNQIGVPKAFKGLPLTLITLGLIALTFMGLAGLL